MCKKILVFVIFLITIAQSQAQTRQYPNGITFKATGTDYIGTLTDQFFIPENYALGAELGYMRYLKNHLSFIAPLRYGFVQYYNENGVLVDDDNQVSLDLGLKLHTPNLVSWIDAYAFGAVGGNYLFNADKKLDAQVPIGVGLDFKVTPKFFFELQGEYRTSLLNQTNNTVLSTGFMYLFGPSLPEEVSENNIDEVKDSDEDGIQDNIDECIFEKGTAELGGCPDKDGDGIIDKKDKCPDIKGTMALEGCQLKDKDNDGVDDSIDECPESVGLAMFNGCPDSDADGIPDHKDECIDRVGDKKYNGCPDSDKDGIADNVDPCPTQSGKDNGCPPITVEDQQALEIATESIYFASGSSTLSIESTIILDKVAMILSKYPNKNLSIEGHTDNTGYADLNKQLSTLRARACYDYLVLKGIPARRMSYEGFGSEKPLTSNNSEAGRRKNRRTEFIISSSK